MALDAVSQRAVEIGRGPSDDQRLEPAVGRQDQAHEAFDLGRFAPEHRQRLVHLDRVLADVRAVAPQPEPDRDRQTRPAGADLEGRTGEGRVRDDRRIHDRVEPAGHLDRRPRRELVLGRFGWEGALGRSDSRRRPAAGGQVPGVVPAVRQLAAEDVAHRLADRPLAAARVGVPRSRPRGRPGRRAGPSAPRPSRRAPARPDRCPRHRRTLPARPTAMAPIARSSPSWIA